MADNRPILKRDRETADRQTGLHEHGAEHTERTEGSAEDRVTKKPRLNTQIARLISNTDNEKVIADFRHPPVALVKARDAASDNVDQIYEAFTAKEINDDNALAAVDTALREAEYALAARKYIAEAIQAFRQRRKMARSKFDRNKTRVEDMIKDDSFDKTGGRTSGEWKEYSQFYLCKLGEAFNEPEMAYWSTMNLVAMGFINGNADAARRNLSKAATHLNMWEKERHEFPAAQELEQSCQRRADPAFLQHCQPIFKLNVEQQILWLEGKKTFAELTSPRGSNILDPLYKFKMRMPELITSVEPGTVMPSWPTMDMARSHRTLCKHMLQRIVQRMVEGVSSTKEGDIRTFLLDDGPMPGSAQVRFFDPCLGARFRPREHKDIARSKHHVEKLIGKQSEPITRTKIDRVAIIVRYGRSANKDSKTEIQRVKHIAGQLPQAFPDFQFPPLKHNIMIRAERTTSPLIPSLWYDQDVEIGVSKHSFFFGDYKNDAWVHDEVSAYSNAEAFTQHLCAHFHVCQDLNMNSSCLLIGIDVMGCHWPRMLAFVRELQNSLGRCIDFFIQSKYSQDKMTKLCPWVVNGNCYGRVQSEHLLQYASDQQQSLPRDVFEAIAQWEDALARVLALKVANKSCIIHVGRVPSPEYEYDDQTEVDTD